MTETMIKSPAQHPAAPASRWRALRASHLWSSAAFVLGMALAAKLVGALKEVLVAERFGAGALVDQFVFVCTLAAWPAALGTSVLTAAMVPLLARPGVLPHVLGLRVLRPMLAALIGIAVIVAALFSWLLPLWSPMGDAAPPVFALSLVLALVLGVCASWFGALLQATGRQIGVLLEALPAISMIGLLSLVSGASDWMLPAGAAAGALLHALVLQRLWTHVRATTPRHEPALDALVHPLAARRSLQRQWWRQLRRGVGLATLAYAVMSITPAVELALAGRLGEGSTSSLGYAMRVAALASGLVAVAVNRVALLHFCQAGHAPGGWMRPMIGFGLASGLLSIAIGVFAPELVGTLFERGAFDAAASSRVADLTRWQIASLMPYVVSMVLCAALVARGRLRALLEASVLCALVRIGVATFGSHEHDTSLALLLVAAAPLCGYAAMCLWLAWRLVHDDRRPAAAAPHGREAFDVVAAATRPAPLGS